MSEKKLIPVDDIAIDTTQARRGGWDDDEKDKTLINSIKGIGLIYDIIVRPTNSEKYGGKTDKPYALIAGSRRLNASIRAGITDIPCKIMALTDTEAIAMSFSENIGRKDLTEHQRMDTILTWIDLLMETKYIDGDDTKRRRKAILEIAETCYGGNPGEIYGVLLIARLPKELQILVKKSEERTEADILILKEYNIKPDFKMDIKALSAVEKIIQHLGIESELGKVEKIFEIIKTFSLDEEPSYDKRYEILGSIRDKLKEAKTFEIVMKEVKEEHDILTPKMSNIPSVAFKLPAEYGLWHTNALNRANMKTAELVRTVYLKWLEREAKKEGW